MVKDFGEVRYDSSIYLFRVWSSTGGRSVSECEPVESKFGVVMGLFVYMT